jgi:hypothetical protein
MSEGGIRLILQEDNLSEDAKIDLLVVEIEKYTNFKDWMVKELGRRVFERERVRVAVTPAGIDPFPDFSENGHPFGCYCSECRGPNL